MTSQQHRESQIFKAGCVGMMLYDLDIPVLQSVVDGGSLLPQNKQILRAAIKAAKGFRAALKDSPISPDAKEEVGE